MPHSTSRRTARSNPRPPQLPGEKKVSRTTATVAVKPPPQGRRGGRRVRLDSPEVDHRRQITGTDELKTTRRCR